MSPPKQHQENTSQLLPASAPHLLLSLPTQPSFVIMLGTDMFGVSELLAEGGHIQDLHILISRSSCSPSLPGGRACSPGQLWGLRLPMGSLPLCLLPGCLSPAHFPRPILCTDNCCTEQAQAARLGMEAASIDFSSTAANYKPKVFTHGFLLQEKPKPLGVISNMLHS